MARLEFVLARAPESVERFKALTTVCPERVLMALMTLPTVHERVVRAVFIVATVPERLARAPEREAIFAVFCPILTVFVAI